MPEAGGSAARNKILIDPHAPKFLVSVPGAPSCPFWARIHSKTIVCCIRKEFS